jgi:hypothetical protein
MALSREMQQEGGEDCTVMALSREMQQEGGVDCTVSSLIICTSYQIQGVS